MAIKEYIRKQIKEQDLRNLQEVQYIIALYFENKISLPKWLEYKVQRLSQRYNLKPTEILASALINKTAAINLMKKLIDKI